MGAHDLISQALCLALSRAQVRAEYVRGCEFRDDYEQLLRRRKPDVVLLDLYPSHETQCGHSRLIPRSAAEAPTVVLSSVEIDRDRTAWLMAGAIAVLGKTIGLLDLSMALMSAAMGQSAMDPAERERLLEGPEQVSPTDVDRMLDLLSPTEGLVLAGLMQGSTAFQIAEQRVVSIATIRSHVRSILVKLNVHSQVAAIAIGHRANFQPR